MHRLLCSLLMLHVDSMTAYSHSYKNGQAHCQPLSDQHEPLSWGTAQGETSGLKPVWGLLPTAVALWHMLLEFCLGLQGALPHPHPQAPAPATLRARQHCHSLQKQS